MEIHIATLTVVLGGASAGQARRITTPTKPSKIEVGVGGAADAHPGNLAVEIGADYAVVGGEAGTSVAGHIAADAGAVGGLEVGANVAAGAGGVEEVGAVQAGGVARGAALVHEVVGRAHAGRPQQGQWEQAGGALGGGVHTGLAWPGARLAGTGRVQVLPERTHTPTQRQRQRRIARSTRECLIDTARTTRHTGRTRKPIKELQRTTHRRHHTLPINHDLPRDRAYTLIRRHRKPNITP